MTSNLHIESQTTKKYGLPLSHLEYSYIEKCTNVKELEKIVSVLRSGDEGRFPDLEKFAEKRLELLNPKSHALRKERPILQSGDLECGDRKTLEEDMKTWTNCMHEKDSHKPGKSPSAQCQIGLEVDENLPPIRSTNIVLEGKKQKKPEERKKKRAMPRDYKEWDKLDVEAELNTVEDKPAKKTTKSNNISVEIDTTGMSEEEKDTRANREKDKGNEAFRSQDFEEAVTYYSRSISLLPISASYNNRALAYLKLKKWDKAIRDCNSVLDKEVDNIKALMRRGTAYKNKKDFKKASEDLEKVLTLEPNNKKAEDLLKELKNETAQEEKARKEKGRRMVIEEVDSEDEADEEIEVDKAVVNGYGPHEKCDTGSPSVLAAESDRVEQDPQDKSQITLETGLASSPQQKLPISNDLLESSPTLHKVLDQTPLFVESSDLAQGASSVPTSQEGLEVKSPNSENLSPAALHPTLETGVLPPTETPGSLLSRVDTGSPKSKVPFASDETAEKLPVAPLLTTEHSIQTHMSRPQLVQLPLPPVVSDLKEKGNVLFRSGQYGEAVDQYTQAITKLEKEYNQQVNLSLLLSNRAMCHLKTGNLNQTVSDCSLSLQLVPHGTKTLLRRAAAYEGLEKYAEAYVDYKHALSLDGSADQAHQGSARCQSTLQQKYGATSWREKIPPLVLVRDWEVPIIVNQTDLKNSVSSTFPVVDQNTAVDSTKTVASQETTVHKESIPQDATNTPLLADEKTASVAEHKVTAAASSQQESPVTKQQKGAAQTQPSKGSIPQQTPERSKEQEFEDLKAKGNQYVQKGQFQEAAKCYSTCIALCPNQVACYTNRALCYLKLNKINDAESDCDKALSLQADNPKALYRRALARKACLKYKLSLQDLIELLKLEPKNSAAQKEMDIVKKLYKEELEKLKKKATTEQESKIRKRVKIEEVDDDEEEEKSKPKGSDKLKGQNKSRSGKQPQQSPGGRSKANNADKKQSQASEKPNQGQPMAPPIAPRLMKTTPFEFCQAWNSLKTCQSMQPYADVLRQIAPADLPSVISNKLDGQMLQVIVRCVYEEMVLKGDIDTGYKILDRLCHVPRFSTVSMFMTSKEKKEVSGVLDILSKTTSSAYTAADIVRLKKEYSVK